MYFSSERDRLLRRLYPLKRLTQRFRANAIGYVEPLDMVPMPELPTMTPADMPVIYEQQLVPSFDAGPQYELPAATEDPLIGHFSGPMGLPLAAAETPGGLLAPAPGLELDSVPNPAFAEIADAIEQARLGQLGPAPEPGGLEQLLPDRPMGPGLPEPLFMT